MTRYEGCQVVVEAVFLVRRGTILKMFRQATLDEFDENETG